MQGKCLIFPVICSGLIQLYKGFWLHKYLEDLITLGGPHNPCRSSKNYAPVSSWDYTVLASCTFVVIARYALLPNVGGEERLHDKSKERL